MACLYVLEKCVIVINGFVTAGRILPATFVTVVNPMRSRRNILVCHEVVNALIAQCPNQGLHLSCLNHLTGRCLPRAATILSSSMSLPDAANSTKSRTVSRLPTLAERIKFSRAHSCRLSEIYQRSDNPAATRLPPADLWAWSWPAKYPLGPQSLLGRRCNRVTLPSQPSRTALGNHQDTHGLSGG